MNSSNYAYWFFESAIPLRYCDALIRHAGLQKDKVALTGDKTDISQLTNEEHVNLKKTRNSSIAWMSDKWIYNLIHPFINEANVNAGWNYKWDYSEACQFTKYNLNQFYDWHSDSWFVPYKQDNVNKNYRGKIRKLSVTCLLSDENEYEGGNLEFQPRDQDDPNMVITTEKIKKKGTIIVFPSYTWHRVTPVTKGTRYSLVVWSLGNPFV